MASAGQNYRLFVVYHLTSLKALDGLAVVGLFTFFASLTYAYHYLMKLIK